MSALYPRRVSMVEDTRSFWIAAPRLGEIRVETLQAGSPDDVVVPNAVPQKNQPRNRGAVSFRDVSRWANISTCGHRSRLVRFQSPEEDQVWLCQRRAGRARTVRPAGAAASSHCTRTRRGTSFPVPSVHVLPDAVPPGRAVLAANLETAIDGVWDAGGADRQSCHR